MQFQADPIEGYFLKFVEDARESTHTFCGRVEDKEAQCPNCRSPFLRFLKFDPSDGRLRIQGLDVNALPLYFCWRCPIAQEPFFYQLLHETISIIKCGKGASEQDFPYPNYPQSFPERRVVLEPVSLEIQRSIILLNEGREAEIPKKVNNLDVPQHQVGGVPYLLQYDPGFKIVCPKCNHSMPFFAAIGDNSGTNIGFTGNTYVQVLYHMCRGCKVIGAYQVCD